VKAMVVTTTSGSKRSVGFRFDDPSVTGFGGVLGLKAFADRIGLTATLRDEPSFALQALESFSAAQIIEQALFLRIAGFDRFSHALDVTDDLALDAILGERASVATLFRRLARFSDEQLLALKQIGESVALHGIERDHKRLRIAIDSTVLTVFGDQEHAEKGYNPDRRGAKSYNPLVAATIEEPRIVGGFLRPGNAASLTNAQDLVCELSQRLGKQVEAYLDAGFFGDPMLRTMESVGWTYVVSAPARKELREQARNARFSRLTRDSEIASFEHEMGRDGGKVTRRFIVLRRFFDPKDSKQGKIFAEDRPFLEFFYVTNLRITPREVVKRYNLRARIELVIRDLKENYALECIPSESWAGNAAHVLLSFLAFNVLGLCGRPVLKAAGMSVSGAKLRNLLVRIAARVVRSARRIVLAFSVATPMRRILEPFYRSLARASPTG
jgi:DDE family transposase